LPDFLEGKDTGHILVLIGAPPWQFTPILAAKYGDIIKAVNRLKSFL
jgi:hypothetical protein